MSYNISLKKSAEKSLILLDDKIHNRLIDKIISLSENPRPVNAKKLKSNEYYRIRFGDYRILYTINDKLKDIEIIAIDHRKDAYRNL